MKTFSPIKPRDPEADPATRRRSSLVAHEEAAFEAKVTAWQRKINAEDGTDHEVNLGKIRKISMAAEDVVKRPKADGGNRIKRPLSSYGVIFAPSLKPDRQPSPLVTKIRLLITSELLLTFLKLPSSRSLNL